MASTRARAVQLNGFHLSKEGALKFLSFLTRHLDGQALHIFVLSATLVQ